MKAADFRRYGVLWLCLLLLTAVTVRADGLAGTRDAFATVLRESAESFVRQRITTPNDSAAVSVEIPSLGVNVSKIEDFEFELFSTRPVVGTVPLKVSLILDDGSTLAYAATARVRLYATVMVAAERLDRHEIVRASSVRPETREVTHVTDAYFADSEDLPGKRVTRIVSPGTLLRASDVEAIPLVERGSGVMVTVVVGRVTVTSRAKALQDGELGDVIKVEDLTTGKRYPATVAGASLVVLDETML
jgi:flagella basal body P-ring formation protein FlgA